MDLHTDKVEPEWMTDELRSAIKDTTDAFQRAGGFPHPSVVDHYKLATLIEVLLEPADRTRFELRIAETLRELAEQAASQAARAKLLEGVTTSMPNGHV